MSAMVHVESAGEGQPLVMLHGWAMHAGMWGPLVPHLARRHHVHAADLPGHGRTPRAAPFTLESVARALDATFADEPRPLAVVGWSLGGLIAMRWALSRPERIGRLVLIGATLRFVDGRDWPHAMSQTTMQRFGDELRVAWKKTVSRFLALQLQGSEHGRAALACLRRQVFARGEPSPEALAEALEALLTTDLRAEARSIASKTLAISGSRDVLTLPAAGAWLAAALPDARFALIDGAAHAPFLSHPDATARAIDEFLDAR
jgi:pimeloyl-[acyl-carrier protein] methyl ester esterase